MIEIKDLTVKSGHIPILSNVSLTLKKPFRIGVVGASGSGKSTLAKALCMLLDSSLSIEGQISYDSTDLYSLKEKQRRLFRKNKLKYLVQEPFFALNPYLKIKTQLNEAFDYRPSNEVLMSYLHKVGLHDQNILNAFPLELSGGQRQRLSLLQGIIQNPEVLIADEPTTALDPIKQKDILDLIKNFLDLQNSSLIFVSHDLKATCMMTDVIYVMHQGRIIETLPSYDFFDKAEHPFTQSLIDSLIENHLEY